MPLTTTLRPLSFLLVLLSTLTSLITAQTVLDASKLPSCYTKCTPLGQANSACVPPSAPVSNQGTYQGCFCASQFLVALYSTPNGLCDSACSSSDEALIQQWYLGLCHGGVVVTPAGGAQVTQGAGTGTSTATTTDTSVTLNSPPTSTASGTVAAVTSSGPPKSWASTHWRWILLLVILFVAFVFFLVFGFWFKRRHRRRRDAKNFSGSGQLRTANSPSPFASGILAPSDGAYIGSARNHRPMSAVPDTRSVMTMERIGSPRESMLAMSVYSRDFHDVPSPPPLAGSRSMPWLGERQDSGETGGSVRSKMGGTTLREEPVAAGEDPDVSPIEDEMPPMETRTGRKSGESRRSRDGSTVRRKLSKKSKTGSIREMNSEM